MKRILYFVLALGLVASCQTSKKTGNNATFSVVNDVTYLASDALGGRKPGTHGDSLSVAYISEAFTNAGLTPLTGNGIIPFQIITETKPGENLEFVYGENNFKPGTDFLPMPFSANGGVSAPIVFAGFGIEVNKDSLIWNDYANLDVKGKWVLVLRGDPDNGKRANRFGDLGNDYSKVILAADKGAAGIIFANGPKFAKTDEFPRFGTNRGEARFSIPAIFISRATADVIFLSATDFDVASAETSFTESGHRFSFETSRNLTANAQIIDVKTTTFNVAFVRKSKNAGAKYLVAGAHYDHLGMGGQGSGSRQPDTMAVHNGADDNASGVALLLNLARKTANNLALDNYNILFVAFGAEERGLLGSKVFVESGLVQPTDIKMMLNFDMVGRFDDAAAKLQVGGTGTALEFDSLLTSVSKELNLNLEKSTTGTGPSDHSSFYAKSIPVLFISTGAHDDYHLPRDDSDKINMNGIEKVTQFGLRMMLHATASQQMFQFREAGPKEQANNGRRGMKVKLGIMPAFGDTENKGVKADAITPGGPAAIAGMQKGDYVIGINGMPVKNIYEYMDRLNKFLPGDRITLEVQRNDNKITLIVQL